MKRSNFLVAALFISLPLLMANRLFAQCLSNDKAPLRLQKIAITSVTCPQNGAIAITGVSGGGGEYAYEIFNGPVVRGIQSQPSFKALSPGRYSIRVTGCNGSYADTTVIVGNYYLETATQTQTYLSSESYKCNTVANGKVRVAINYYLPTNEWSDTQYYSLPLRYQVSEDGDPATGFNKAAYHRFANGATNTDLVIQGGVKSITKFDTIIGLKAGTTYYIRVSDQCGNYKTSSITIPTITAPIYSYDFKVTEPFDPTGSENLPAVKGNCVQWGLLSILANGRAVRSIPASSTFAPVKAVLKRQDNGQVIDTRIFEQGNLYKLNFYGMAGVVNNNLLYDSIPRVPVRLEITDQCGTVTAININNATEKPAFQLQGSSSCTGGASVLLVNTVKAAPSLPARFKVYNESNELLINKIINSNSQYIYKNVLPAGAMPDACVVPGPGKYRLVMIDQCGTSDSIQYEFGKGEPVAAPEVEFKAYEVLCASGDGNKRFNVDAQQLGGSAIASMQIISGPQGLVYPRVKKTAGVLADVSTTSYGYNYKSYFDSLVAGDYQVQINYGCDEKLVSHFTVSKGIEGKTAGYLSFTTQFNPCGESGSTVINTSNITGRDINFAIADPAYVRILEAPMEFLKMVTIAKKGATPTLPFVYGNISADNFTNNGIDTNAVSVYPRYSLMNLSGAFIYPPGDYTFQLYTKCSGAILDTRSFTIQPAAGYSKPMLGASSAYVCGNGSVKIVVSPVGGRRPFQYQVKLASDPDNNHYSPLQADSIFLLPAATKAGTVYSVRVQDACNNSFTGQVAVNDFNGKLFIGNASACLNSPATVITGNIPGAVYTWTKPDGSITRTNSGTLYINRFTAGDAGNYKVAVDAVDGCIKKVTTGVVSIHCNDAEPLTAVEPIAGTGASSAAMQVYANPFTASFNVDFTSADEGNAVLMLFDLSGKEISRSVMPVSKGTNRYQFTPVANIEPGTYIFSLMKDGAVHSSKVTKVK